MATAEREVVDVVSALKEEAATAPEVTIARNRFGYEIDGEFYRRVTTFCDGIPKPWLGTWAAKQVAEFALEHQESWKTLPRTDAIKLLKGAPWTKRDDAGDRGTAVHKALECFVRKQSVPGDLSEDEAACAASATAFLEARGSRVLASELTVFNPTFGYAGTLDLWEIDRDGVTWVLDYKTSSYVYSEHAVQLAAYRNASFALVHKKPVQGEDEKWTGRVVSWGPEKVQRLGIVHVKPDGATLHPIRYTDRLWTVFRAASHVKLWQLDTDDFAGKKPREMVFEKVTPTTEEA